MPKKEKDLGIVSVITLDYSKVDLNAVLNNKSEKLSHVILMIMYRQMVVYALEKFTGNSDTKYDISQREIISQSSVTSSVQRG